MMDDYLKPGQCIESDDPQVLAFAQEVIGKETAPIAQAILLYKAVRDRITYDPYMQLADPAVYSGKRALELGRGFCIPKAALLAGCARAIGIPARVGFADVRNHLASPRLVKANNGDLFRWHAYAQLYLNGKWVKATPAFDVALCARCGIHALEFDGFNDSIFLPYDKNERQHMEYVLDRGTFAAVPADAVIATFREHSPGLLELDGNAGSFAAEVTLR